MRVSSRKQVVRLMHRRGLSPLRSAKRLVKTKILTSRYPQELASESHYTRRFVLQPMVESANHDWKVLVLGAKLYALRRAVRKNDFRASGSGMFEFANAPASLLDYAINITSKLDTPFLSLDIIEQDGSCNLLEFQATHFGPYTLINAPHHYELKGGSWQTVEGKSVLEVEYARSLAEHIRTTGSGIAT